MNISTYGYTTPNIGMGVALASQVEVFRAFGSVKSFNESSIRSAGAADVFYFHSFPKKWEKVKVLNIAGSDRKIGFWVWESSEVSKAFEENLKGFDEIWTCSYYCKELLDRCLGIESKVVNHFVTKFNAPSEVGNVYTFLFMFDGGSRYIRKNPFDLVKAFQMSFGKGEKGVKLIIKCKNLGESILEYLKRISKGWNIEFLEDELSYAGTMNLLEGCDCFVSAHRSEGFGLGMLEAMGLGKLAIATRWGGNLDFMTDENSVLVECEEGEVDDGFYKGVWGFVNVEALAESMKKAVSGDYQERVQKGFETALEWNITRAIKQTQKALG